MPGPPRTPTAIRVLRGVPDKRPLPPDEPKPAVGILPAPSWLSAIERHAWKRFGKILADMKVLTVADAVQLELVVVTYGEWRGWDDACRVRGRERTRVVQTQRRAMIVVYPEFAARAECGKRLRALLSDFGMSPAARSRVTTVGDGDGGDDEGAGWVPGRKA